MNQQWMEREGPRWGGWWKKGSLWDGELFGRYDQWLRKKYLLPGYLWSLSSLCHHTLLARWLLPLEPRVKNTSPSLGTPWLLPFTTNIVGGTCRSSNTPMTSIIGGLVWLKRLRIPLRWFCSREGFSPGSFLLPRGFLRLSPGSL